MLAELLDALETAEAPVIDTLKLNGYRWWEPKMRLPAVWHWLSEDTSTRTTPDGCAVEDTLRINVSVATTPGRHAGDNAHALEALADALRPVLDAALAGRRFAGSKRARRVGMRLELERFGDVQALAITFPLELVLEEPLPPAT